jgi:uncharacterized protein (DUF433 family)
MRHDIAQPYLNPKIVRGRPVIRGTRITVELIIRKFPEGADEKVILAACPHLTSADLQAALSCAARPVAHEDITLSSTG